MKTFSLAFVLLVLTDYSIAQITITQPTTGSSITQCNNFTILFTSSLYIAGGKAQIYNASNNLLATYDVYPSVNNNVTVSNITPGTGYYLKIYDAYNSSIPPAYVYNITVNGIPPPSLANATSIAYSFVANWNAVAGASDYKLDVATDPGFTNILSAYNNVNTSTLTGGTTSKPIYSGIQSGTTYYYRVRTVKNACISVNPANPAYKSALTLPAAPTLNYATEITSSAFKIIWPAVQSATQYSLELSTSSNFSTQYPGSPFTLSGTEFNITNLSPLNTIYYVRVKSFNATGYSSYSSIRNVCLVPPPTSSNPSNITSTSFLAKWVGGGSSYYGFFIDVAAVPDFGSIISTSYFPTNSANSKSVTGLTPNTTYYYRVRATTSCDGGASVTGNSLIRSALTCPSAPILNNPSASNVMSNSIVIDWTSSGTSEYRIDVSTNPNFIANTFVLNNSPVVGISTNIAGLNANNTYYIRVRSQNSSCSSINSNTVTVTTSPAAPILAPVSNVTCESMQINWAPSGGAISYELKFCTSSDLLTGCIQQITTSNTYAVVGPLSANTTYYYAVRAVASNGSVSNYSTTTSSITSPCAPTATIPTFIRPSGEFTANWIPISGATHYLIDVYYCNPAGVANVYAFRDVNCQLTYQNFNTGNVASIPIVARRCSPTTGLFTGPFYYRVRAVNSSGLPSPYSNVISVVIGNYIPGGLTNTNIASNSFTANWSTVPNSQGYEIDLSTSSTFTTLEPGYPLSVGLTNSNGFSALAPNTTYYWRVRAIVLFNQLANNCTFSGTGISANGDGPPCVNCRNSDSGSNSLSVTTLMGYGEEIEIFPNPVNTTLKIRVPNLTSNDVQLTLINTLSQTFDVPVTVTNLWVEADVSSLTQGIYIVNVRYAGVMRSIRIQKL